MRFPVMILYLFVLTVSLGTGGGVLSASAQDYPISAEQAMSQFISGGLAYKEGDYDRAVKEYEEILKGGRENGALYYNLGNSYFRKKDYGRAVLNYERARRLIPRDSDLDFNYHYALSQMGGESGGAQRNFFQKAMDRHISFYTLDEMILMSAGLGCLIAVIHLVSLYLRWSRRVRRGILGVLFFLLAVYISGFIAKAESYRDMAVAVSDTEAKFEPRPEATAHFPIKSGIKIKFLKTEDGWTKIRRTDGKTGWVPQGIFEYI
jgi:tetratricopeptide (TPR) repeat protein